MRLLRRLFQRRSRRVHSSSSFEEPLEKLTGLVLYKMDACPYCKVVQRRIDQLNVEISYRDTRTEPMWRKDLRRRTGKTQVPCLFIQGEAMFESKDIVAWLEQNYQ